MIIAPELCLGCIFLRILPFSGIDFLFSFRSGETFARLLSQSSRHIVSFLYTFSLYSCPSLPLDCYNMDTTAIMRIFVMV